MGAWLGDATGEGHLGAEEKGQLPKLHSPWSQERTQTCPEYPSLTILILSSPAPSHTEQRRWEIDKITENLMTIRTALF